MLRATPCAQPEPSNPLPLQAHGASQQPAARLWMTPRWWQCATTLTIVRISCAASFSLHRAQACSCAPPCKPADPACHMAGQAPSTCLLATASGAAPALSSEVMLVQTPQYPWQPIARPQELLAARGHLCSCDQREGARVVPPRDDAVKQLAARAQLHHLPDAAAQH